MKLWIDLSNSPHPLLFAPIARRHVQMGNEVLVTVRNNAQTAELALERWPDAEIIGGQSSRSSAAKATAIAERVMWLRRWARAHRPEVALSHNSYAQIVAARSLGLPVVTAMDYEHQPANHLAFRLATRVLLPEALPQSAVRHQGATAKKVRHYPGLKEELYLGDFQPDPRVLSSLGLERGDGPLVVTRTPPSRALYHRRENRLYADAIQQVARQPEARCVLLARHPEHREAFGRLPNVVIPDTTVDSRSLMYTADLVVGGGGTMTREAALLGVPTVTVFAGPAASVDAWLERRGLLARLEHPRQVAETRRRTHEPRPIEELRRRSEQVLECFVENTLEAGRR